MPIEPVKVEHPGGGVSRTRQSEAVVCDINKIMDKWIAHGVVPLMGGTPKYGDFSGVEDFHTELNRVNQANEQFMALPSRVRDHCDNDPGKFLEMVYDPDRRGELEELGMLPERAPEAAPPAAEPEPEPAATAAGDQ